MTDIRVYGVGSPELCVLNISVLRDSAFFYVVNIFSADSSLINFFHFLDGPFIRWQ